MSEVAVDAQRVARQIGLLQEQLAQLQRLVTPQLIFAVCIHLAPRVIINPEVAHGKTRLV